MIRPCAVMVSGWRCSYNKLIKLVAPGYLRSNLKISATEFQDDLTIAIQALIQDSNLIWRNNPSGNPARASHPILIICCNSNPNSSLL